VAVAPGGVYLDNGHTVYFVGCFLGWIAHLQNALFVQVALPARPMRIFINNVAWLDMPAKLGTNIV
jgi:hypothetical protein